MNKIIIYILLIILLSLLLLKILLSKNSKNNIFENAKSYKLNNPNFKEELLKNPEKLTSKLFNFSSDIKQKLKYRHQKYYKEKISPKWESKIFNNVYANNITDKIIMYPVIKELGIPLPIRYYEGSFDKIDWNNVPKKCVVKPTTGWSSMGVYLFDNNFEKNSNKNVPINKRKKFIEQKDKYLIKKSEWVIEEYIEDYDDNYDRARDFKCYVADGNVWFILVYSRGNKNSNVKEEYNQYTRNWLPIKQNWNNLNMGKIIEKPKHLNKLIEYAELISSKMKCFLRIDFYMTKRGPIFGEFTTFPNNGGYVNEGRIALSQLMELFPDKF